MNKVISILAFVCVTHLTSAQTNPGVLNLRAVDMNSVRQTPGASRSFSSASLSYFSTDETITINAGGAFHYTAFPLNTNYDPDDSIGLSDQIGFKWAAVVFDTLYDFNTFTSYPYAVSTVLIDSIGVFCAHINLSGTPDTIVVTIYEYQGSNGMQLNAQLEIANPVLFEEKIITSTSLSPDPYLIDALTVRPNLALQPGQKFVVGVHYYGALIDTFMMAFGFGDRCSGNCGAYPSAFPGNSHVWDVGWIGTTNYSGINSSAIFMDYDCDHDSVFDPQNCEAFHIQNFAVAANVKVVSGFEVAISPDTAMLCGDASVQLTASIFNGTPPYTVTWSPSVGLSTTAGITTIASPQQDQVYTVTVIDSNNNVGIDMVSVLMGFSEIDGKVEIDVDNQIPAPGVKVILVQTDSSKANVAVQDSTFTDANGEFYFFTSTFNGIIKIIPDSAQYPNFIPTYFPFYSTVQDAYYYEVECRWVTFSMALIPGTNPGGPGFIAGFVSQGAGKRTSDPVTGLSLILYTDSLQPVAQTVTDHQGYFSFSSLALGVYRVYVDQVGVDNNAAPTISLTAANPSPDSLEFLLFEDHLESANPASSIIENTFDPVFNFYPNPVRNKIYIQSALPVKKMVLYDIYGKAIKKVGENFLNVVVDAKSIPRGTYFLHVEYENYLLRKKILVY